MKTTGNREVITGSDYKRMLSGAYGEFLLAYEEINALSKAVEGEHTSLPGTHVLRTMAAAVAPLAHLKDESIGGLARRAASAAILGARGAAGVVLGELFRGIAKGLSGKYDATSSEFGKAFQYGILYAQRVLPKGTEEGLIETAKAASKGAYHAVRGNLPISEILEAAIAAGEAALQKATIDSGAKTMLVFLQGCLRGLDGHFVSPALSLSIGVGEEKLGIPDPKADVVRPYCLTFIVENAHLREDILRQRLATYGSFVTVTAADGEAHVHVHSDCPGDLLEQAIGWGKLREVSIRDMAEPHALGACRQALLPVALLAIAKDHATEETLQELGACMILEGSRTASPSVAEILNATHSDLAASYVIVAGDPALYLVLRQAKRVLGSRVEIFALPDEAAECEVARIFDKGLSARENAKHIKERLQVAKKD